MAKILLIEDDDVIRENTAEILSLAGHEPLTAPDGKSGVELAQNARPDVVICDVMMPDLDGYSVLRALSGDPATRDIPFVFMTAKTEKGDVRKGLEAGADDYLTKPFEEEELLAVIEKHLTRRRRDESPAFS